MKPKKKKCKVCKTEFEQFNSLISWCSPACGYKLSQEKLKDKKDKEWRVEKKKLREKLKTLKQYEAEAKKSFQHWIRLRDKDKPCISCGEVTTDLWDGGHYFKAELYSGLIFDERNVHKQCRRCNRYLGGNEIQYRIGLVERFGSDFVNQLEKDSIDKRVYKFSKQELIAKKMQYDIKIKQIKND